MRLPSLSPVLASEEGSLGYGGSSHVMPLFVINWLHKVMIFVNNSELQIDKHVGCRNTAESRLNDTQPGNIHTHTTGCYDNDILWWHGHEA